MRILGLTADYIRHDSSICLVEEGKVRYAVSEERFSKLKNDPRSPLNALEDMLERYDLTIDEIDAIAIGMPFFRFMKGIFDSGYMLLAQALLPVVWKNPALFFSYAMERFSDGRNKRLGFEWLPRKKVHYISHYLAHGASAYRTSGFNNALCVILDAAGADVSGHPFSGSVFLCKDGEMQLFETVPRFTSIGCFYNAVTQAVAFRPVGEDWKLMGLAAFGDPNKCYSEMASLAPRFENGRWTVTRYTVEAKLIDRPILFKHTQLWKRLSQLVDRYSDRDVAAAAQKVFEDHMVEFFEYLLERTNKKNLALAGGIFHNIKCCMRLRERFPEHNMYIHPAAGDVGTALGAALELYHQLTGEPACYTLKNMALGPEYNEAEMAGELTKYAELLEWKRPTDIAQAIGVELASKKVVGLFHGRSEWGPRALGQRSVIADPSDPEMRNRINNTLKDREWFMPFAPSIIEEDCPRYLKNFYYSPFMTDAFQVTMDGQRDLASAIHLDSTARPQIVRKDELPHYYSIIDAFKKLTGIGAVLNTSFNRHGLPIVNCPKDAINHLLWGCVDVLALGPFLVIRKGAPKTFKQRISFTVDEIIKKWDPFDQRMLNIREKRRQEAPLGLE